jgi:hypothetical protein
MTDPTDAYDEELRTADGYTPASSVTPVARRSPSEPWPSAETTPADESERAQLIAGIARLIREPAMPESARLAALTLIGWLARRRPQEAAHAIGVEEARKSERQWRAARPKAR